LKFTLEAEITLFVELGSTADAKLCKEIPYFLKSAINSVSFDAWRIGFG